MRRIHATSPRKAISFIEVLAVIAIFGIVMATAVPAVSQATQARIAEGADEIEIALIQARACAINTGTPYGVTISSSQLQPVYLPTSGNSPQSTTDSMNQPTPAVRFANDSACEIKSCVAGDGATLLPITIWFAHDGTPQVRANNGTLAGDATYDSILRVGSTQSNAVVSTITVRKISGAIELNSP